MAKTRSQTGKITIKKEEEEEDRKPTIGLRSMTMTTRSKITKQKPFKGNNRRVPAQQVKVEEDTDTKSLLQSSPKLPKRKQVSQGQINQLIDYVENHGMSIDKASHMAKISPSTGYRYYDVYKNDPKRKIPTPRNGFVCATQEHIRNLVRHIVDDKMTIKEASEKANLDYDSGKYYYKKYLDDPEHNIPIPNLGRHVTEDQKNAFIGYIVNDKMSIAAASKKAKMDVNAGHRHYHKYFNDQTPNTTAPNHITKSKHYTREQINEVISCIVNDKMTISAASRKVNMCSTAARRHYHQYLTDRNMALPDLPWCSQDKIDEFIGYIVNDKMTIRGASKKANMRHSTGQRYYHIYLKDYNLGTPTGKCIRQDQIDELVGYIVDDKMTIKAASKKANMHCSTGGKYYRRYLKAHNIDMPTGKGIRQDQIDEFIGYIVNDKMTVKAASKKANMHCSTGGKYYRRYLKVHNIDPPALNDRKSQLIGYIIDDKMSIYAASKKANIAYGTGRKNYLQYVKNQKRDAPTQRGRVVSASKNEQ